MHGSDPGSLTAKSSEQAPLPFALIRGGTSKAVFLRGRDLRADVVRVKVGPEEVAPTTVTPEELRLALAHLVRQRRRRASLEMP